MELAFAFESARHRRVHGFCATCLDGKAREMGLGRYPDISLIEARLMAAEARVPKATGIGSTSQP